jgi:hypothetical protein
MERRRAVRLSPIHIGLLLNERANGGFIAFHRRVRNLTTAGGRSRDRQERNG